MTDQAPHSNGRAMMPSLTAGNKPTPIVPSSFDDCYRMARMLAASGMVPDSFKSNVEVTCVAIMQGLEVGLSPMAAVQSIAVINGRPTLWGDGLLAVVRASALLEWISEEWDADKGVAKCTVKRRGEPHQIARTFSLKDAEAAGLLKKPGPWQQYRPRMCQMRARSWALRDVFADVLKGLRCAEEEIDAQAMKDITPKLGLPDIPDPAPETTAAPTEILDPFDVIEPIADEAGLLDKLRDDRALCESDAELTELAASYADILPRLSVAGQRQAAMILAIEE